jgi:YidC/Oxa1 family membrane protein insertase
VNKGVWEQFGNFQPKHLDPTSQLYRDLSSTNEMSSLGMNLAESAQQALSHGFGHGGAVHHLGPGRGGHELLPAAPDRRSSGRLINPQQQMLLKIMPVFFAFISLTLPAGIVVYFLVSNLFRIGQQALHHPHDVQGPPGHHRDHRH